MKQSTGSVTYRGGSSAGAADPAALGCEVTAFITPEIRQARGHDPVAAGSP